MLVAGWSNGSHAGAALAEHGLQGVCAQERVTRLRSTDGRSHEVPTAALELLLQRAGRTAADIGRSIAATSDDSGAIESRYERIDHHRALACTAYLTSPYPSAVIVVCDREAPFVSVWSGDGAELARLDWPWTRTGFAAVYSECAKALGFRSEAGNQRFEALARLAPDERDSQIDALMTLDHDGIAVEPVFERRIEERLAGRREPADRAAVAASLQGRIADLLIALLSSVRQRTGRTRLCLAGGLFHHSSLNTAVKAAGIFPDVFVPVDPGDAGLAVGACLHAAGRPPDDVSAFLGPRYSQQETKDTLDNCKLQYDWESEDGAIAAAVRALEQGTLVAWFEGGMEWGQRALGARSILANPMAPYVLENLNRFLKRREPWRGYALSGLEEAVATEFAGPATAPFMECDFRPRDPSRWRHILPSAGAAVRVQTVPATSTLTFRRLLEAFGDANGVPFLVNTSFNGFHEPIVCSPRDAVRVFYGTGVDVLIMNQFLLTK